MPSLTLGTGGIGGAVVGDNITVTHVINRKRVAWEMRPYTTSPAAATGVSTVSSSEPDIDAIVTRVLARLAQPAAAN